MYTWRCGERFAACIVRAQEGPICMKADYQARVSKRRAPRRRGDQSHSRETVGSCRMNSSILASYSIEEARQV